MVGKQENLYYFYENVFKDKDLFNQYNSNLVLQKQILYFSEIFSIKTKDYFPLHIEEIYAFRKSKISVSSDNYLFRFFMRNHLYLNEFLKNLNESKNENFQNYNDDEKGKINREEILKNFQRANSVTEIEIKDFIVQNFMSCLKENTIDKKPSLRRFSHREIIEKVCVEERLMYYNFLVKQGTLSKENIKKYLNKKYIEIVLKSDEFPNVSYDVLDLKDCIEIKLL